MFSDLDNNRGAQGAVGECERYEAFFVCNEDNVVLLLLQVIPKIPGWGPHFRIVNPSNVHSALLERRRIGFVDPPAHSPVFARVLVQLVDNGCAYRRYVRGDLRINSQKRRRKIGRTACV